MATVDNTHTHTCTGTHSRQVCVDSYANALICSSQMPTGSRRTGGLANRKPNSFQNVMQFHSILNSWSLCHKVSSPSCNSATVVVVATANRKQIFKQTLPARRYGSQAAAGCRPPKGEKPIISECQS